MASSSWCPSSAASLSRPPQQAQAVTLGLGGRCGRALLPPRKVRGRIHGVICMAPQEERKTRRSPLDFPIEWERPKAPRRPDIFPHFSPMRTPLPHPLPEDPPEEDEEEEEEQQQEGEENPEEDTENPDQSKMQH